MVCWGKQGLFSLEKQSYTYSSIQLPQREQWKKISSGAYLFSLKISDRTQGNGMKPYQEKIRVDIGKLDIGFYTEREISLDLVSPMMNRKLVPMILMSSFHFGGFYDYMNFSTYIKAIKNTSSKYFWRKYFDILSSQYLNTNYKE